MEEEEEEESRGHFNNNHNNNLKRDGQSDSSMSVEPSSIEETSFSQVTSQTKHEFSTFQVNIG